jgi:peroxiredoxin
MALSATKGDLKFLLVILACSLGLNVFLGREWLVRTREAPPPVSPIQRGDAMPAFEGKDLAGQRLTLRYNDTKVPTVLYVFRPSCVWCSRNLRNVNALVQSNSRFRFIGVCLEKVGLDDYLHQNPLGFPVVVDPSEQTLQAYRLGGTPQTVVISPEGRVLENWLGAYGDSQQDVERFFGLKLPGLVPGG